MEGTENYTYPDANAAAVRSMAGAIATTYGPAPRDTLIVGDEEHGFPGVDPSSYRVTSDAATILEGLDLDHPVAPIIERVIGPERPGETDVEGQDIPDGIAGTVILAAALLDEALELIEKGLHPRTIQQGYSDALDVALAALGELRRPADGRAHDVARSAMTGNAVGGYRDEFAGYAVEAMKTVGSPDPERFAVSTISNGQIGDSRVVDGVVLDRNDITDSRMPQSCADGTVLLLDGQDEGGLRALELNDRYTATVSDPDRLAALQDTDAGRRLRIVQKLREHGVDVVVAKQGIEKEYAAELAEHGIIGIDGVTRLSLSRISHATGAEPVKRTEAFSAESLGQVGRLRVVTGDPVGEGRKRRQIVVFEECNRTDAAGILVHGVWGQLAEIATTELRKAARAVSLASTTGAGKTGLLPGGGATDALVSMAVERRAETADSREQFAWNGFAEAVEMLVFTLGKNIGYDPHAARPDLRAANERSAEPHGFLFPERAVGDVTAAGVFDPYAIKRRSYVVATDVATLLLRIDDVLPATFSEPAPDPDDAIYEDAARQQQSYLENHDETRWDE